MPDEPVFKITEKMYETLTEWQHETEERDNQSSSSSEQQPKNQEVRNENDSAESNSVNSAE